MLHSSLDRPWDSFGSPEPGYSLSVEWRLARAYRHLVAGASQPSSYSRAHDLALQCQNLAMSVRQRMRVFFVLGSALIASDDTDSVERGVEYAQQAMTVAESIPDWLAWIELAYLAGSAKSSILKYADATHFFIAGLSTAQSIQADDGDVVTDLEFSLLLGTAYAKYLLGESAAATRLLIATRGLSGSSLVPVRAIGTLDWMEALALRWDGQPEEALVCALKANHLYERATTPSERLSYGRLQTVIMDIALDIVERLPAGTGRDAMLLFSEPLAHRARSVAQGYDDTIGGHLATLAQARWNRVAGRDVATHEAIWRVVGAAENIGDAALQAQAHTAFGYDLLSRGWRDAGLNSFRQTLRDLRSTQIPAMGKWARDKLVEASRETR